MLNACSCVVYVLIRGNDAVCYIPHDFGYYLSCLIYDKKTEASILDVYHKFNILSWITVGFLFFLVKRFRRSFVFSLVIAIGSILSQFAPYFTLFWTKNLDNPLFEYNASLKNYFKFDIDVFYGFLFFQGYVYLWYRIYKNNAQSIENQSFVKILFVTIGFFIIFYSILS